MTEYNNDLQKWQSSNIFMNDRKFSQLQTSLVPINILYGSYQTYTTKIQPQTDEQWRHIILFPGTAFKFPNHLNAQYTAKSLLAILEMKNIPTKIYPISHRLNPIYPEATSDTLEMLELILKQNIMIMKSVFIITWSAGCCHLEQAVEMFRKAQCKVEKVVMVSPVVDMANKQRENTPDFLNEKFFQFIEKFYCSRDNAKISQLSLARSLEKSGQNHFLINIPLSIVYGSQEYIRKDIEEFIEQINKSKKHMQLKTVDTKCFEGQNHAMYSFVTSKQTRANITAMSEISKAKWHVSKYIVDYLVEGLNSNEKSQLAKTIYQESIN